ncbi:universal stress protein [Tunturiibacter gelidiferens]|uniref:Universal stress protein n=1 Tax=Tunturiibacter gelidiferens TaxID=3069689 RepID=A0AAU7YV84_9BACT
MPTIGKSSAIRLDSIIFATDFSPASQNAGLYASAVSVHFGTGLVIAHAFTLVQAALEVEAEKPLASQQRTTLKHELALTAEILDSGKGTTEYVLVDGDPRKVIPVLAQRRSPALIVLGTHGGGSIDRFVLGSTAEGILRHSSGPALTVGPNVNILRAGALNIRRILYATDCTAEAAHAAPVAVALADAFAAELDVLNVVRSREIDHPEQLRRLQEHFYGAVDAIMPHNAGQVCEPHTFVSVGQPYTEILNHVSEREIDLLVLGLRRNTHLGMQNRTSGVFPIIVRAKCPVITVASGSTYQP